MQLAVDLLIPNIVSLPVRTAYSAADGQGRKGSPMTRKHYRETAAILAAEIAIHGRESSEACAVANVGRSLADMFARNNERFDRARFYNAATIERK